ncbi:MAG TPA: radical SAM protein, partial [Rhodothermales bacterium]
GESLMDLLRALDRVSGVRFRISSIEPNLLTDETIDFIAESDSFHPHFHLPLQSGDDYVLGRMRRRYRSALYRDRVERILALMPDACIGADVIVGFPAETEAHFENSRAFLADLPVSYLHVFTYSERENAPIARSSRAPESVVPTSERNRRNGLLRDLSRRKRRAFYETQIGSVREVLWERPDESGNQFGYTDNYVRLRRPADPARHGAVERVRLGGFMGEGVLLAEEAECAGTLVR